MSELDCTKTDVELLDAFDTPLRRVHDWRSYVDESVEAIWKQLTHRERVIVYLHCERRADIEEWE